jgi:ribose/xylose/arabinose/galactoside ABC-type transport system permease subunit
MGQVSLSQQAAVSAPPAGRAAARTIGAARAAAAILGVAGLLSLLFAQQLVTGWIALGERANILRSDLNPIELLAIAVSAVWGVFALWAAAGLLGTQVASVRTYLNESRALARVPGALYAVLFLLVVGIGAAVIAQQVLTGWLALGERLNISRRDLNIAEWGTAVLAILWAAASLRTALGLARRESAAWRWAQWISLATIVVGLMLSLSGTMDMSRVLPAGGTLRDNPAGALDLVLPSLIVFFSALGAYRYLTIDEETSAYQHIRNRLAKSPGAGAIVGFIAIAAMFTLASDLFLEPRSLASILATNITRGIVAIGITFLMISGEFDLSVGSVFGAGALIFLLLMTEGLPLSALTGVPLVLVAIGALSLAKGRAVYYAVGVGAFVLAVLLAIATNTIVIMSVIPAALVALVFAAILGMINGVILIRTGIPSFIVTLGTLLAYRAILLVVVADGRILRYADYRLPPPNVYFDHRVLALGAIAIAVFALVIGLPSVLGGLRALRARIAGYAQDTGDFRFLAVVWTGVKLLATLALVAVVAFLFVQFGLNQLAQTTPVLEVSFFDLMNGRFDFVSRDVNLRIGVMWWLLLVLVFQFILTQTRYGNHVFAVGGNPGAARAQGINVNRVKVVNFMICSMLAAFAGIVSVARLANVDPLMGDGLELDVIAASVIGGALLTGGYGSIIGALLGVLIFGMLQTGLVLIGVDARAFSGVIGIIIIVAVVINTAVRRIRT